jgi:hypothetical protein
MRETYVNVVGALGPVIAKAMPVVASDDENVSSQVKKYDRFASRLTCSTGPVLPPALEVSWAVRRSLFAGD